jgi:hypothetical protein
MRPSTRALKEAVGAYSAANKVTTPLVHRLAVAVVQDMANEMGGPVRITLPGNVVIERSPQEAKGDARVWA